MLSHYDYDPTHNATAILCALGIVCVCVGESTDWASPAAVVASSQARLPTKQNLIRHISFRLAS